MPTVQQIQAAWLANKDDPQAVYDLMMQNGISYHDAAQAAGMSTQQLNQFLAAPVGNDSSHPYLLHAGGYAVNGQGARVDDPDWRSKVDMRQYDPDFGYTDPANTRANDPFAVDMSQAQYAGLGNYAVLPGANNIGGKPRQYTGSTNRPGAYVPPSAGFDLQQNNQPGAGLPAIGSSQWYLPQFAGAEYDQYRTKTANPSGGELDQYNDHVARMRAINGSQIQVPSFDEWNAGNPKKQANPGWHNGGKPTQQPLPTDLGSAGGNMPYQPWTRPTQTTAPVVTPGQVSGNPAVTQTPAIAQTPLQPPTNSFPTPVLNALYAAQQQRMLSPAPTFNFQNGMQAQPTGTTGPLTQVAQQPVQGVMPALPPQIQPPTNPYGGVPNSQYPIGPGQAGWVNSKDGSGLTPGTGGGDPYEPGGGTVIGSSVNLPAGWGNMGAAEKIDWFNQNNTNVEALRQNGVTDSEIAWMKQNGYTGGPAMGGGGPNPGDPGFFTTRPPEEPSGPGGWQEQENWLAQQQTGGGDPYEPGGGLETQPYIPPGTGGLEPNPMGGKAPYQIQSEAMKYATGSSGMGRDKYYSNIRDWLGAHGKTGLDLGTGSGNMPPGMVGTLGGSGATTYNPMDAETMAAMREWGISPEDYAAATGTSLLSAQQQFGGAQTGGPAAGAGGPNPGDPGFFTTQPVDPGPGGWQEQENLLAQQQTGGGDPNPYASNGWVASGSGGTKPGAGGNEMHPGPGLGGGGFNPIDPGFNINPGNPGGGITLDNQWGDPNAHSFTLPGTGGMEPMPAPQPIPQSWGRSAPTPEPAPRVMPAGGFSGLLGGTNVAEIYNSQPRNFAQGGALTRAITQR